MAWDSDRIEVDTINKYISKVEVNVVDRTRLLALLKQRGRLLMGANESGRKLDWLVEYARGSRTERQDGANVASYGTPQRRKVAELGWGKIEQFEGVTKGEMLKAQGKQARVKLLQDTVKACTNDVSQWLVSDLYDDGGRVGPVDPIYGMKSVLGRVNNPTAAYPTPSSSHTYAGLRMDLGGLGGAVTSGTYPAMIADPEYYAWTPLQANYEHADFGSGTTGDKLARALRRLFDYQGDLRGDRANVDVALMPGGMYTLFKDSQEAKQRFNVSQSSKKGLVSLGFSDVINYDGVEVGRDAAVPQEWAIGLHLDGLTLRSMQSQLIVTQQEFWLDAKYQKIAVDFWGQFQINPWQICAAVPDLS